MTSHLRSRNNTFASLELERFAELRDDADWLDERLRAPGAQFLVLGDDGRLLVSADHGMPRGLDRDERERLLGEAEPIYLGQAGNSDRFLLRVDAARAGAVALELGAGFANLRHAGRAWPAFEAGLFAYALGLANWQARTRYCSNCAAPLKFQAAGHRAKCTNPQCGMEHFPRTDPAIIVIVEFRDACLLGRMPRLPPGRFTTLAGFVEPGESLEDAVRREVFEEAGVRVAACDYHSSQPWPFPASIMLGFTAQAEGPRIQVGPELAEARWFSADQLIDGLRTRALVLPPRVSVAYRLIEHWLRQAAGAELGELVSDEPFLPGRD
ncbi:MAG TPA: NAD(+) diphosphatase [Rudaea sp.]|nr:NAD(+) diphosphatase [Rudaea sp.]